jgi:hypothetical protein
MEHRWGARTQLEVPVRVDCGSGLLVLGLIRDASVSGAFLATAARLPLLSCVEVQLVGTQGILEDSAVSAYVVRRAVDGYGLEWSELAPAAILAQLHEPQPASTQTGLVDLPHTTGVETHVAGEHREGIELQGVEQDAR